MGQVSTEGRHKRFVEEYLLDLNATRAAIAAGYSAKTAKAQGCRLLTYPYIREAVQAEMDKRSERTAISADYVLTTIHETVERCKQAKPVLDRKGEPVLVELPTGELAPAYEFDAAAVLKGCELLGKHLKLFTDKVEHGGSIVVEQVKADAQEFTQRIAALTQRAAETKH